MTEWPAVARLELVTLRRVQITCLAGLIYAGLSAEVLESVLEPDDPFDLVDLFSLSSETNLPTWFASAQLLLCSVAAAVVAIATRQDGGRYAVHWWGLAAAFGYISIDETVQIHEQMNHWFSLGGVLYFGWVIPAAVIVALFGLSYLRFLAYLPKHTRNRFVLAGAIFVGGALGVELGLGYWTDLEGDQNLIYAVIDWVEESMELCGIGLMLYSLVEYGIARGGFGVAIEPLRDLTPQASQDADENQSALLPVARRGGSASLVAVWALLLIAGGAIVATGLSTHHHYEDKGGRRLHRDSYLGEDMSESMRGGQRFVYVGAQERFDQSPGVRSLLLIAMGGAAVMWTASRLTSTTANRPPISSA